jgi:dephospho-CoA kinase
MHATIRIGLTGSVGSGKSRVRHWLGERGAAILDLDQVAHAVVTEPAMVRQLVEAFGEVLLDPSGQVDRSILAAMVFADSDALSRLEALVHPPVRRAAREWLGRVEHPLAVIEGVKLVEGGLAAQLDRIWLVSCSTAERRIRLASRAWNAVQIERRIAAAPPMLAQLAAADRVIDNSGPWSRTVAQLERAWLLEIARRMG